MKKHILITGTHSYIGTSFQQYIEKKNGNMPSGDQWHVTFVSVRNEDWKQRDFHGYDAMLHVAGIVHRKEQPDMEELYNEVNTRLTVELAQKAKAEGIGQFVFLSTMSIYGITIGHITRDTKPAPVNLYGKSKLEAEKKLKEMETEAFCISIVRPPMIYGKDCTGNYALLEKLARKVPLFPKVKNERSMLYIDNLSEFLRIVIDKEQAGIFHPQNAVYVNTSEMVAKIAESYNRHIILVPGFDWFMRLLAKKVKLFSKVFGSLTYEQELSDIGRDYNIADFETSISTSRKK